MDELRLDKILPMNKIRWIILPAGLVICAASAPAADLKVTVVNVGQGDGIHIQTPSGKNYLVDGGDTSDAKNPPALNDPTQDFCPMVKYLLDRNIRTLDFILKTNDDHDHYGGLEAVLGTKVSTAAGAANAFTVKAVIFSSSTSKLTNLASHTETATVGVSSGTRLESLASLAGIWDPDLTALVLSPRSFSADPSVNSGSIVLKVTYKQVGVLLTADAESPQESDMIADFPADLPSTVLKVGHHGSRTSSSAAFLNVVKPKLAIISAAPQSFGLPDQDVLTRISTMTGAVVMQTHDFGHITVVTNGVTYSAQTTLVGTDVRSVSNGPDVHVYPNPAPGKTNPAKTTIVYSLNGVADEVRVAVYTVSGELVRDWAGAPRNPGTNYIDWDLKNVGDDDVANGLYIVQAEARTAGGSQFGRAKMAVLKK